MTESKGATDDSRTVVNVVRSVWRAWSSEARSFDTETAMQGAFRDALQERLASPWIVTREVSFFRRTWSRYDVGVSRDDRLVALFELSVHDTNVAHALHNGELKLLGRSDGVGITSGSDFAAERGLTPDDVVNVRRRLAAVPVRGIFYIGAGSRGVLDKTTKAA